MAEETKVDDQKAEAGGETEDKEALKARLEGDIDKVLAGDKTWAEVLGISGEQAYGIANVGYKLLQEANYDDAETIFRGLVTLNSRDANLQMWLGSTLHRKGEVKEAIAAYTEALDIDPKNATCLANRGELLVVEGKAEEGTKDLMKAIEIDPESKQPSTVRARAILATIAQKLKDRGA
ncbi:tetratricopeptide repeat protein [Planctomycetota bacterium]